MGPKLSTRALANVVVMCGTQAASSITIHILPEDKRDRLPFSHAEAGVSQSVRQAHCKPVPDAACGHACMFDVSGHDLHVDTLWCTTSSACVQHACNDLMRSVSSYEYRLRGSVLDCATESTHAPILSTGLPPCMTRQIGACRAHTSPAVHFEVHCWPTRRLDVDRERLLLLHLFGGRCKATFNDVAVLRAQLHSRPSFTRFNKDSSYMSMHGRAQRTETQGSRHTTGFKCTVANSQTALRPMHRNAPIARHDEVTHPPDRDGCTPVQTSSPLQNRR